MEFRSFNIRAAGLTCLITALPGMRVDEPLVQEILCVGLPTANVFRHGDGSRIVGAVLWQAQRCSTGSPDAAAPTPDLQPPDAHP